MITALVSILVGAIVASIAAWLYSQRWPAPQPRARITKDNEHYGMWKVEIFGTRPGYPYNQIAIGHFVLWEHAIRFANDRVAMERRRGR